MKTIFIIGMTFTMWCTTYAQQRTDELQQKQVTLQNFHTVHVDQGITLEAMPGRTNEAVIKSHYLKYIQAEVKRDTLFVTYDGFETGMINISAPKTQVQLTAKSVTEWIADPNANINIKGNFSTDNTTLSCSSGTIAYNDFNGKKLQINASVGGKVKGNFKVNEAKINAVSGAEINADFESNKIMADASMGAQIKGKIKTDDLVLNVSNSGRANWEGTAKNTQIKADANSIANLENLISSDVKITADSMAKVNCVVEKSLEVKASSMSKIRYKAVKNPITTTINKSSMATVEEVGRF